VLDGVSSGAGVLVSVEVTWSSLGVLEGTSAGGVEVVLTMVRPTVVDGGAGSDETAPLRGDPSFRSEEVASDGAASP